MKLQNCSKSVCKERVFKYLISKYEDEDGDIIHNNNMNIDNNNNNNNRPIRNNIDNLNINNNRNPRSNFGQRWRLTVDQP